MLVVYIAGPYRAKTHWGVLQNVQHAERLGLDVAKLGAMPLIPHKNTENFDGELPDEFWLAGTLELLRRCDAVLTTALWRESRGARAEVAYAEEKKIPVFHSLESLDAWLKKLPRSW